MKRFFNLLLGALALVAVALISAFIAMRLAIHGREAVVPNLSGLTMNEAASLAARQGLALNLEDRFYSADVPAGHILAQAPAAGLRVRREWPVRITESLGAQRVNIPDLTGQTERSATINIRSLSLELGTVARLAVAGAPDIVLTQTPPANAGGVASPRVSLLVSDAGAIQPPAYVMPTLTGLSYSAASVRATAAGLRLVAEAETAPPSATPPDAAPATAPSAAPVAAPVVAQGTSPAQSGPPTPAPSTAAVHSSGIVTAQSPQAGSRVVQGDEVHVTLGRAAPPAAVTAPPQ